MSCGWMWCWIAQVTVYKLSSERSTATPILRGMVAVCGGVEAGTEGDCCILNFYFAPKLLRCVVFEFDR